MQAGFLLTGDERKKHKPRDEKQSKTLKSPASTSGKTSSDSDHLADERTTSMKNDVTAAKPQKVPELKTGFLLENTSAQKRVEQDNLSEDSKLQETSARCRERNEKIDDSVKESEEAEMMKFIFGATDMLEVYRNTYGFDIAPFDYGVLNIVGSFKGVGDFKNCDGDYRRLGGGPHGSYFIPAIYPGLKWAAETDLSVISAWLQTSFEIPNPVEKFSTFHIYRCWYKRYLCYVAYVALQARKALMANEKPSWRKVEKKIFSECEKIGADKRIITMAIESIQTLIKIINLRVKHIDWRAELRSTVYLKEDLSDFTQHFFFQLHQKAVFNGILPLISSALHTLGTFVSKEGDNGIINAVTFLLRACALIPFSGNYTEWNMPNMSENVNLFNPQKYRLPTKDDSLLQAYIIEALHEAKMFFLDSNHMRPLRPAGNKNKDFQYQNEQSRSMKQEERSGQTLTEHDISFDIEDVFEARYPEQLKKMRAVFEALKNSELKTSAFPMVTYLNCGVLLLISEEAFKFKPSVTVLRKSTYQLWSKLKNIASNFQSAPWHENSYVTRDEHARFNLIDTLLFHADAVGCAFSSFLLTEQADYLLLMSFVMTHPACIRSVMLIFLLQILYDVISFQYDNPEFDFTSLAEKLTGQVNQGHSASDLLEYGVGLNSNPWSKSLHLAKANSLHESLQVTTSAATRQAVMRKIHIELRRHQWCQVWGSEVVHNESNSLVEDEFAWVINQTKQVRGRKFHEAAHDLLYNMLDTHSAHHQFNKQFMDDYKPTLILDTTTGTVLKFTRIAKIPKAKTGKLKAINLHNRVETQPLTIPRVISTKEHGSGVDNVAESIVALKRMQKKKNRASRNAKYIASLPNSQNTDYPSILNEDILRLQRGAQLMSDVRTSKMEKKPNICMHASQIFNQILEKWVDDQSKSLEMLVLLYISWVVSTLWGDENNAMNRVIHDNMICLLQVWGCNDHPILNVLLAKMFLRRRAFIKAEPHVSIIQRTIESGVTFETLHYPCTKQVIYLSTKEGILKELGDFQHDLETRRVADQYCRYPRCELPIISYRVDFKGYCKAHCTEKCDIAYHNECLVIMLSSRGISEFRYIREETDFYCLTPDCTGALGLIEVYNQQNKLQTKFIRPERPVSLPEKQPPQDEDDVSVEHVTFQRTLLGRNHRIFGCKIRAKDLEAEVRATFEREKAEAEAKAKAVHPASASRKDLETDFKSSGEQKTMQPQRKTTEASEEERLSLQQAEALVAGAGISSLTGKPKIPVKLKSKYRR